ncbi:MAG TPA: RsmG family class I SAM-dependent methyltransferase [Vicinamibacterales bacterium]|nr:RsmG family class I SAM-dependent methyltransferase [Vicinamibacterales bacterium]
MSTAWRSVLARRAAVADVPIPEALSVRLVAYLDLLEHWNRTINLTSLREPDAAIDRLVLEPLMAARYLPDGEFRLVDIGSGGGSPALPLVLAAPQAVLTMVEVRARKAAFLRTAVRDLPVENARVEEAGVEEVAHRAGLAGSFSVASVRGVRLTPTLLGAVRTLLRPGGGLFLFSGPSQVDLPGPAPVSLRTHSLVQTLGSRLIIASW